MQSSFFSFFFFFLTRIKTTQLNLTKLGICEKLCSLNVVWMEDGKLVEKMRLELNLSLKFLIYWICRTILS
jgi:hypothetical protein